MSNILWKTYYYLFPNNKADHYIILNYDKNKKKIIQYRSDIEPILTDSIIDNYKNPISKQIKEKIYDVMLTTTDIVMSMGQRMFQAGTSAYYTYYYPGISIRKIQCYLPTINSANEPKSIELKYFTNPEPNIEIENFFQDTTDDNSDEHLLKSEDYEKEIIKTDTEIPNFNFNDNNSSWELKVEPDEELSLTTSEDQSESPTEESSKNSSTSSDEESSQESNKKSSEELSSDDKQIYFECDESNSDNLWEYN